LSCLLHICLSAANLQQNRFLVAFIRTPNEFDRTIKAQKHATVLRQFCGRSKLRSRLQRLRGRIGGDDFAGDCGKDQSLLFGGRARRQPPGGEVVFFSQQGGTARFGRDPWIRRGP
jgi:hypothetical protein